MNAAAVKDIDTRHGRRLAPFDRDRDVLQHRSGQRYRLPNSGGVDYDASPATRRVLRGATTVEKLMPSLLVSFAFGLAAMAPVIAVILLVLMSVPGWRAAALRALIFALAGGVGCFLVWFAYQRVEGFGWYPALVTLGAGFSLGGVIVFLWRAVRPSRVP